MITTRTLVALLTTLALAACGGGGDATVTAPAATLAEAPATNLRDGYNPDGTIPPAAEPTPPNKPCRVPQASDEGIENGKPPVGRCD